MHIHDATEQAYKNGYKAGMKDFAEKLKKRAYLNSYCVYVVTNDDIDNLLKELTGKDNKHLTMPDDYHFEVGV
jgi:Holliday junction resolvase RusA-like endonuclease